jgi:hypothetical protein
MVSIIKIEMIKKNFVINSWTFSDSVILSTHITFYSIDSAVLQGKTIDFYKPYGVISI